MTLHLVEFCVDAQDPPGLARYWSAVLRREVGGDAVLPSTDTEFPIRFLPTREPKTQPNQVHFDLTSASAGDRSRPSRGRSSSAAATSTSVSSPRRSTSSSLTRRATSSA